MIYVWGHTHMFLMQLFCGFFEPSSKISAVVMLRQLFRSVWSFIFVLLYGLISFGQKLYHKQFEFLNNNQQQRRFKVLRASVSTTHFSTTLSVLVKIIVIYFC